MQITLQNGLKRLKPFTVKGFRHNTVNMMVYNNYLSKHL
jgi:hypothetical protein